MPGPLLVRLRLTLLVAPMKWAVLGARRRQPISQLVISQKSFPFGNEMHICPPTHANVCHVPWSHIRMEVPPSGMTHSAVPSTHGSGVGVGNIGPLNPRLGASVSPAIPRTAPKPAPTPSRPLGMLRRFLIPASECTDESNRRSSIGWISAESCQTVEEHRGSLSWLAGGRIADKRWKIDSDPALTFHGLFWLRPPTGPEGLFSILRGSSLGVMWEPHTRNPPVDTT
jgi:hypothetical protein